MSEEQKPAEVAFGFVGQSAGMTLTFSDGERLVPDYVVETIGREAL